MKSNIINIRGKIGIGEGNRDELNEIKQYDIHLKIVKVFIHLLQAISNNRVQK